MNFHLEAKRRALKESIQFEIPGSDEYNDLMEQLKSLDDDLFNIMR